MKTKLIVMLLLAVMLICAGCGSTQAQAASTRFSSGVSDNELQSWIDSHK